MTAALPHAPFESARATSAPLRVLIALPGLHKVLRGAETALESVAMGLASRGHEVTLIGSGLSIEGRPYRFIHAPSIGRERFTWLPSLPFLRSHYAYEELSFAPALWRKYRPADFDITLTCGFPYCNWILKRKNNNGPLHIYVTQNGDHMLRAPQLDYRQFACDGLVCTNPEYFERNKDRFPTVLIPNGVDPDLFKPGPSTRAEFGLPEGVPLALMVSALIPSKRVADGIRAVAANPTMALAVAGDGELATEIDTLARSLLPGRFFRLSLPREKMPALYRSADVFLHMSTIEASANAYMEALATGLPIVTHDWAVTRWTLEDTALLVDSNNIPAVTQALALALARRIPLDIESRRALIRRRFSWNSIAEQYEHFFRDTLLARK